MDESDYVHKKTSSEILFADYGNLQDGEDPTAENQRVIDLMDPVDSMSLNREKNRVVVSGIRGVLQVVKIRNSSAHDINEGPSIVKDIDMRVYRKSKLNILYSAQNVKWNQIYDQYIATTSSNGSIVCWNVARRNKSVYKAHERSATCLDWHSMAPYILVSGSRDCCAKSYDLRVKDIHQLTFTDRNCESVRDVAFCKAPGFADYFFTGDDGGVLRLWDMRHNKFPVLENVAHRSFVSTLSLNPLDRSLIATGGGRDKMVKIWDWTGSALKRKCVVETTAPLGRVAWRPDKPYQLATCASVNETTVHVWDIRRPYVPYVTYDEHRDSVTDACWPNNDCDVFMTCGKDGLVVLHNIDSGHAPITYACDVAFDMTPDGCMSLAVNSEIHAKNDAALEERVIASSGKKAVKQVPYETFEKPIKSLIAFGVPESLTYSLPPTMFYEIAEKYLIGGFEITQLCEINSKFARKSGQEHVAQTWRLVEALCGQARIQEEYDRLSKEEKERVIRAWVVRKKELAEEGRRWLANLDDFYLDDVKRIVTERLENTQHVTAFLNYSSSSDSDSDEENKENKNNKGPKTEEKDSESEEEKEKKTKEEKTKKAPKPAFFFGTEESNYENEDDDKEPLHHNEFVGLRYEAFVLRDEEKEAKFFCKARKQPANAEEYERMLSEIEADFKAWSPMLEIYRLLLYHAEQGDMQTCATISMVCGQRLFDAVDPYTVNGWILCYMEMLNSLELFMVCAKIRKYCPLESISSVSRENTTIQLAHAECNAIIVNGRCTKCEKLAEADCTVCRFPIVGMTYQCHVCCHSMHANHAYEWFQKSTECAYVGCPCNCGQNSWPDLKRTFVSNTDRARPHRKYDHSKHRDKEDEKRTRFDLSRPDTDSDSDDGSTRSDVESSATTDTIKAKLGVKVREDKPWEKHLKELYTARYQTQEKREKVYDTPISPKSLKLYGKGLRGVLEKQKKQEDDEFKALLMSVVVREKKRDVDRTHLLNYYLEPEKYPIRKLLRKKPRQLKRYHVNEMEIIDEVDEDEEEEREKAQAALEEAAKGAWGCGSYGDQYIDSIGPIGLQKWQILERVTSPIRSEKELTDNLRRVTEFAYGSSDEEVKPVKEERTKRRRRRKSEKKELTLKEKALAVLNMSKDQMKKKREKKRQQKETKLISNGKNCQLLEYSSDEFAISSAEDSSSTASSSNVPEKQTDNGYRAGDDYFSDSLSSTSHEELEVESDQTPAATGDLYTTTKPKTKKVSIKVKKSTKVSRPVCCSSDEQVNGKRAVFFADAPSQFVDSHASSYHSSPSTLPVVQVLPTQTPPPSINDLRDSDATDAHLPQVTPPLITSCTNPIFDKIANRPRSSPMRIGARKDSTGSTSSSLFSDIHSVPANQSASNHLFRRCASLPANNYLAVRPTSLIYSGGSEAPIEEEQVEDEEEEILDEHETSKEVTSDPHTVLPTSEQHELDAPNRFKNYLHVQQIDVDDDLFSTDEEEIHKMIGSSSEDSEDSDDSDEPFFPDCDGVYTLSPRTIHPWESEEQYEARVKKEREMVTEEELQEAPRCLILEHAEKGNRKELSLKHRLPQMKRVSFGAKEHEDELDVIIRKYKESLARPYELPKKKKKIRIAEKCTECAHEKHRDKQLRERVGWLRSMSDDAQIVHAQSISDPCTIFQLNYMDSYYSDVYKAKRDAVSLNEFITIFYFIKWDEMWRKQDSFMLKEIYDMFDNYRKNRIKVCTTHYNDFKFRFFASSIATKIKQEMFPWLSYEARNNAIKFDWMHLKPCVKTINDSPEALDEIMNTICVNHPNWTKDERGVASQYWNMFGRVPVQITSVQKRGLPPASEDTLEILDDKNYWTKKMLRTLACRGKNADIKLTYTRVRKREEEINQQKLSKRKLCREWKRKLDHFKNETPHFDAEATAIGYDKKRNVLYTDDQKHSFPICQLETKTHFITVRPYVTKELIEFKGRLRNKFIYDKKSRRRKVDENSHVSFEDVRRLKSFKRFEPRLRRNEDLQRELSKYFKVIDRTEVRRSCVLYTILEEEEEDEILIMMLERNMLEREAADQCYVAELGEIKYRKQLADTAKLEANKMRIMKEHGKPLMKWTTRKARRVLEMGRVLVEEDVQKWMEFQYEMTFAKKKVKSQILTKQQAKLAMSVEWQDAINKSRFHEPLIAPVYVKPMPEQPQQAPVLDLSPFNSSSEDSTPPEPADDDYETQPNLPLVAAIFQKQFEEEYDRTDRDEDWEYSDDSSVSTWFENDTDDLLNRLVNYDYNDEHFVLKERCLGAIGRPLWKVIEDKTYEEPESEDEKLGNEIDQIVKANDDKRLKERLEWLEENGDEGDVGVPNDQRKTNALMLKEQEMDLRRWAAKADRENSVQQARYAFRQYALDHSYKQPGPYLWDSLLKEPISALHRCELQRVGHRNQKQMKEEYQHEQWLNDQYLDSMPMPVPDDPINMIEFKFWNHLLFHTADESLSESSKSATEVAKTLEPLQMYEMFFGKQGMYTLKKLEKKIMSVENMRPSVMHLIRHCGTDMQISKQKLVKFMKLWWCNSRDTLERFIIRLKQTVDMSEQIIEAATPMVAFQESIEVITETVDQLEIAYLMNEIIYHVEEFVDETQVIINEAPDEEQRNAVASMDIFDWNKTDSEMSYEPNESSESEYEENVKGKQIPVTPSNKSVDDRCKRKHISTIASRSMKEHYEKVCNGLRTLEEERMMRKAEENARKKLLEWEQNERDDEWDENDNNRHVHDYLMGLLKAEERMSQEVPPDGDSEEMLEVHENGLYDIPPTPIYGEEGLKLHDLLEQWGVTRNLDHQMFHVEMKECQSANTSVTDPDEIAALIEEDFEDEEEEYGVLTERINDDAVSYSSMKHVLRHELHFQRNVHERLIPSLVFMFTPESFFVDRPEYDTWKEIIETSDSPYTFNRLVVRQRLIERCKMEFRERIVEKYFEEGENETAHILKVFHGLVVIIVLDTRMNPWTCRVLSRIDMSRPPSNRTEYLQQKIVNQSHDELSRWLHFNRIDMDVYTRCPVIVVRGEPLSLHHAEKMTSFLIDEKVEDELFSINRHEGVRALDTMIKMPPVPKESLPLYRLIFKPIFDEWYQTWKFENKEDCETVLRQPFDPVREYLHKTRMIVNYAHQYYRMKRFDTHMSKDPTEYQMIDRSDVPSASLFDSLDLAVSKFCNEDSPHLNDKDRQVVKDTLIQLATGKIPHFTVNYNTGKGSAKDSSNQADEENDNDSCPLLRATTDEEVVAVVSPNTKYLELENCEEEMNWLRSLYEEQDMQRRRFMAVLMFELAQHALFKFAPNLANFERGQEKFDHLLTLHAKQRPLLDMMLTKVRGTQDMPPETNMLLYEQGLLTLEELDDSQIPLELWKFDKESLDEFRLYDPRTEIEKREAERRKKEAAKEAAKEAGTAGTGREAVIGPMMKSDQASMGSQDSLSTVNSWKSKEKGPKQVEMSESELMLMKLRSTPEDPDTTFWEEKRALGKKGWKVRRRLNKALEAIADLDKDKLAKKLPAKKQHLLEYVNRLIIHNSDTAHWSWGELQMRTRIGNIPPVHRMRARHIQRILNGEKSYRPPKKSNGKKDPNAKKWF